MEYKPWFIFKGKKPNTPSFLQPVQVLVSQVEIGDYLPTAEGVSLNSPVREGMQALRSGDSNHQSWINSQKILSSSSRLVKISQATKVLLRKTQMCQFQPQILSGE